MATAAASAACAARARPSRSSREPGRRAIRVYATSDDDSKVETKEKFTNAGAFKALDRLGADAGAKSKSPFGGGASSSSSLSDPFATRLGSAPAVPAGLPAGFIADGVDRASLPPKNDADRLLNRSTGTSDRVRHDESSPGALGAHPPLRASCRAWRPCRRG